MLLTFTLLTYLRRAWTNFGGVFDWKADLSGTGDRSESSVLSI